jgi:hypothetical protein
MTMVRGRFAAVMFACLAVAVAFCAVASASASAAEPALFECAKPAKVAKKYVGGYNNKTCTEVNATHEGKYELQEGIGKGKAFKGKAKGTNLEVKGLGGVACTSNSDTGKFTGPKSAGDIVVVFKGCELNHHQCENTGTLGEIKTNPLKGEVGYIEGGKAKHEVGVAIGAETGVYEAEFHCAEIELRVSGTVIGLVTSTKNAFTKEATLLFQESSGEQRLKKLEGGPEVHLQAEVRSPGGEYGSPAESGESDEITNKGEELELKA